MNGYNYLFKGFYKQNPGYIKWYQDHCRIYLDEYTEIDNNHNNTGFRILCEEDE